MRTLGSAFLLATAILAAARPADAQLYSLELSPDITLEVAPATTADDQQIVRALCPGCPAVLSVGLAVPLELDALQVVSGDDRMLSLETSAALGGTPYDDEDVVLYNAPSGTYALLFDGSAAGVPVDADLDALAVIGGDLLLSFDVTATLGAVTAGDEDMVRWDGALFTLFFDGSAAGVPVDADLDAAHRLPNGDLLLSFDSSGVVGGVPFDDEDVLRWTGAAWSLAYDGSASLAGWVAADLDALSTSDADGDGVADDADNCPTVKNGPAEALVPGVGNQTNFDVDPQGDACDNCVTIPNPPIPNPAPFQTTTGGQHDDDADGWGNRCDADYNNVGAAVDSTDLSLFKVAFGKKRTASTCNPGGTTPCDLFDHNGVTTIIDSSDFAIFKALFGHTKKSDGDLMERCPQCGPTYPDPNLPCAGDACP
jgi:hypothetical protein